MKDPVMIGTSHFKDKESAIRYYADYGYTAEDVQCKIDEAEIYLGKPTVKVGDVLSVNDEGRYVITYDRAQKTIMDRLIDAGVKADEIDSHESDLYVLVTHTSITVLDTYEHKGNVTTFTSEKDGKLWYDVPFAYDPYWAKKAR